MAADPQLLQEAEDRYVADWASAGDTSNYNLITWVELSAAYATGKGWTYESFPLTPAKIHGVGTLLKAGGYRSTKNYLHVAKVAHIDAGFKWTDDLALASTRFTASTLRGMGPPRQSEPIDFEQAAKASYGDEPVIDKGPVGTRNLVVVFTFWLLRELEGSTALRRNLRVNKEARTVTMRLTASKQDPLALGVERTWGCVCTPASKSHCCPFCAAVDQQALLERLFGPIAGDDDDPLYFLAVMAR